MNLSDLVSDSNLQGASLIEIQNLDSPKKAMRVDCPIKSG